MNTREAEQDQPAGTPGGLDDGLVTERRYARCVLNSERVAWRVADVVPPDATILPNRPILPEGISGTRKHVELSSDERMLLSQIMGHAYVNLFSFVEEYIVALATRQAHAELFGCMTTLRALLRMAEEEVKHREIFARYKQIFQSVFGEAPVIENATEVAGIILSRAPIAVSLVTLQLELVTQYHYVSSIRQDEQIDPLFSSILKHHWLEEAQHAKIDALELFRMVQWASPGDIEDAVTDYLDLCAALGELLDRQAQMDIESFGQRTGRAVHTPAGKQWQQGIADAYRGAFLRSGIQHPLMRDALRRTAPGHVELILQAPVWR